MVQLIDSNTYSDFLNYSDRLAEFNYLAVDSRDARLVHDAREIRRLYFSSATVPGKKEKSTHSVESDEGVMPDVGVVRDSLRTGSHERAEGSEVGLSVCEGGSARVRSSNGKNAPALGAATRTRYLPPPPPMGTNAWLLNSCRSSTLTSHTFFPSTSTPSCASHLNTQKLTSPLTSGA